MWKECLCHLDIEYIVNKDAKVKELAQKLNRKINKQMKANKYFDY
jgi:hypothetical protein